ncbi:MAG: hypothetical protein WD294_02540 [Phycisphaeraceae bacterium]
MSNDWSGRWLLIGDGAVLPDAAALLRCLFLAEGQSSRGVWASSSLALLAALAGEKVGDEFPEDFYHQRSIEWYPLPRSRFANVRQLLPTQSLSLETRKPTFSNYAQPIEPRPYEEVVQALQERLITFFGFVKSNWSTVHLPLTAGMDSRVLLAAAKAAGCDVQCFTQAHAKMHPHDRVVPEQVARAAEVPYRFIDASEPDLARQQLYDGFTHRTYATIVRETFVNDQYRGIDSGILLRGNCFEVARRGYAIRFWEAPVVEGFQAMLRRFDLSPEAEVASSLAEWLDWAQANPVTGLEWTDRFHLEQRLAGWYAAIEQALDLLPVEHVPPVNSVGIYRLLLSLDGDLRQRGEHQHDLIQRMWPILLTVPINPVEQQKRTLRRRLRGVIRRVLQCVS